MEGSGGGGGSIERERERFCTFLLFEAFDATHDAIAFSNLPFILSRLCEVNWKANFGRCVGLCAGSLHEKKY